MLTVRRDPDLNLTIQYTIMRTWRTSIHKKHEEEPEAWADQQIETPKKLFSNV